MVVTWCVLRAFATLLAMFWPGGRAAWTERCGGAKDKDKDRAGLCGLPPLPQEQGHGKGAERSGGLDEFSDIFFHGRSLRRTISIVRFWGLIARKVFPVYFAILVVCFVIFSG